MGSAVDGHGGHGHGHGNDHGHDHGHGPIWGQQVGVVEGAAPPPPPLLQQVGVGVLQQVEVGVRVGVLQQVEVEVPPLALQVEVEVEVGVTHPSANRIAMYDGKIKH